MAAATRPLAAALLVLAAPSGIAAAAEPAPPQTLSVGVAPASAAWGGFDRDLFSEVGRDIGVGIVWTEVPRAAALAALDAGRFDVAAGPFAAAEARGHRLLPAVAEGGDALLKRRGDGAVAKPADIAGKSVGIVPDAAGSARLMAVVAVLHGRATKRSSLIGDDGEADLAAGRLAAVAGPLDAIAAAALARPDAFEVVGPPFGPTERMAPALRPGPGAARLADTLAGAIGRIRADGRLAALQRKWFGLVFDPPDSPPAAAAPIAPAAPQPTPSSTSKP